MYFVDREKIEAILVYMERNVKLFTEQSDWTTPIEQLALERITHTIIESILDVGNSMIDGFIMRDPGSYEDIVEILEDESVVSVDDAKQLKAVIRLRKMLVQEYDAVVHGELQSIVNENISALQGFSAAIRHYLEHELGPVSAFLPEKSADQ
ncbi:MAG TPA: DUF86 domain-containing protein [Bacilli bacterium]|nr:DUF86 domain-containing protein [Bacilli bacterium]